MKRGKTNKFLRKHLRFREKQLAKDLCRFLKGYIPGQSLDPTEPLDDKSNFRLLLPLRWLVYSFIYVRLKLRPGWKNKDWFLELFDVDEVKVADEQVELIGDMVWWVEGKDAVGKWWPADHEPHWVGSYKKKLRGDLNGGYWVLEPVVARLRMPKTSNRKASYEVEFGKGSTYMKVRSKR